MRAQDREAARRQLDKRLTPLRDSSALARPKQGWIKPIREALGMTASQLGKRLGVSQPRASQLELDETKGSITLETLERAAHALDCRLAYVLIPRKPLETMVEERAAAKAKKRIEAAGHTMALEDQAVDADDAAAQFERLKRALIAKGGSILWDDE